MAFQHPPLTEPWFGLEFGGGGSCHDLSICPFIYATRNQSTWPIPLWICSALHNAVVQAGPRRAGGGAAVAIEACRVGWYRRVTTMRGKYSLHIGFLIYAANMGMRIAGRLLDAGSRREPLRALGLALPVFRGELA